MVTTMTPVDRVSERPNNWMQQWPPEALETAVALQRQLSIAERDWHALKGQRSRRGAEQLAAALVQLLSGDQPAKGEATAARLRALELLEHAQLWLKAEISDQGCGRQRSGG